ncbi:MAG: DUF4041 domain-containing protein [Planctomycetes bacterium]|nr:DUF4041 domain-containing protein [Planctomycetota bacterium]
MPSGFLIAGVVMGCVLLACIWALIRLHRDRAQLRVELSRFEAIADVEQHANEQRAIADSAKADAAQAQATIQQINERAEVLRATIAGQESQIAEQQRQLGSAAAMLGAYGSLEDVGKQIEKQKQQVNRYNQLLGNFKKAEELKAHIAQQTQRVQELNQTIGKFDTVAKLDQHIAGQRTQLVGLEAKIRDLNEVLGGANTASELHARLKYQQNLVAELQAQAQQVEEVLEMQEFGFYRPRFDFESSSKYQQMIDLVRDQQKQMTKNDTAVNWEKKWIVEGSEAQGRKMMAEQTKLMLRAFNGECDAAVGKAKYNNATTMENRIKKSCEQINKLGKTNSASITDAFLKLKLQELFLVHEHRVKQQEEKEEQQRIKEQMREEEKAQKEIEQAEEKAERDEALAEVALERARLAFERATQGQLAATEQTKAQNAALAAQVAKLENELKEAIDRKAKAIARAQLTKSGHVYVLSNIGSFGDEVFKVGMTRRFEPLERVKELGDASVPFPFDVHAMIYSENAPELENKLHQHFAHRRVNLVNLRREYFQVTLEEIIEAVSGYFGEITFVKVPEAAEYRETIAQRKASQLEEAGVLDMVRRPGVQLPADSLLPRRRLQATE